MKYMKFLVMFLLLSSCNENHLNECKVEGKIIRIKNNDALHNESHFGFKVKIINNQETPMIINSLDVYITKNGYLLSILNMYPEKGKVFKGTYVINNNSTTNFMILVPYSISNYTEAEKYLNEFIGEKIIFKNVIIGNEKTELECEIPIKTIELRD